MVKKGARFISTTQVILLKLSAGMSSNDARDGVLTFIKCYTLCLVGNRTALLQNMSHFPMPIGEN